MYADPGGSSRQSFSGSELDLSAEVSKSKAQRATNKRRCGGLLFRFLLFIA